MKKIAVLTALVLLFSAGIAMADDDDQTHRVNKTGATDWEKPWINKNGIFDHEHSVYHPKRDQYSHGYGIDLLTWKSKDNGIFDYLMTEYRYNATYREHSVYSVVGVNGPAVVEGIKGLFQ